jgi:hypothetical protein
MVETDGCKEEQYEKEANIAGVKVTGATEHSVWSSLSTWIRSNGRSSAQRYVLVAELQEDPLRLVLG